MFCFRQGAKIATTSIMNFTHFKTYQTYQPRLKNKNIKVSSFKRSENIRKKEGGPDRCVSNNKFSSVTLNELATKGRERYCNFNISAMQSIQ